MNLGSGITWPSEPVASASSLVVLSVQRTGNLVDPRGRLIRKCQRSCCFLTGPVDLSELQTLQNVAASDADPGSG